MTNEGLFATPSTVRAHRNDLARLGTPRHAGVRLTGAMSRRVARAAARRAR